jgi:hypothetical protein
VKGTPSCQYQKLTFVREDRREFSKSKGRLEALKQDAADSAPFRPTISSRSQQLALQSYRGANRDQRIEMMYLQVRTRAVGGWDVLGCWWSGSGKCDGTTCRDFISQPPWSWTPSQHR